ncbi:MAG: tetratricopeptide repeat protein [Phycisphaerae bacterium]
MPSPPRPAGPRRTPDAVERLYVLWFASTILFVFVLVLVVFFVRGALLRQGAALGALAERVAALETRAAELQASVARLPQSPQREPPPAGQPAPSGTPSVPGAAATSPDSTPRTLPPDGSQPPAASRVADGLPNEVQVRAVIVPLRAAPAAELAGLPADQRDALDLLLRRAAGAIGAVEWQSETWAVLALLALRTGESAAAERFAREAERVGGGFPIAYGIARGRQLLDDGDAADAVDVLMRVCDRAPQEQTARVLLAAALVAVDRLGGAWDQLAMPLEPAALELPDRLRLGRVLVAVERFDALPALLASVARVPDEWIAEREFLRGVALWRAGELPEALAVFDYLADAYPDSDEFETWRGVALIAARQWEAARETLDGVTDRNAGYAPAWYWRAVLEVNAGRLDEAVVLLQGALAAGPRYAPTWEALATLALNRGDIAEALANLARAVELNPRRASAHWLTGLAQAKVGRREPAAESLRTAFALDRALLTAALQTEVLLRLFDPAELAALAEPPEPTTAPSDDTPPTPSPAPARATTSSTDPGA